ncbi:MAG: hypothetical protein IJ795_01840 [Bacteroidales bacterium]|nr:hypothetical protein [Bacteroidales bacterium]
MRVWRIIIAAALMLTACCWSSRAQFKEEAFTQQYNDDVDSLGRDTTDRLFTFSEYFGGVFHKRNSRIGVMFAGSTVFLGFEQIQNRQYWKLPIVYGGLAGTVGAGLYFRNKWKMEGNQDYLKYSQWCFWGTGLVYWATLMDGVYNYKRNIPHQAGKATLYSILLPGLGQAYNGEYWKIPIYYGLMGGALHYMIVNDRNYKRYRMMYNAASEEGTDFNVMSAEGAKSYRDIFRSYRDYSIVALVGFYLIQVIDANVFSYMRDFDLSDDLAIKVSPAVITDTPAYASVNPGLHYSGAGATGFGLRLGLTF